MAIRRNKLPFFQRGLRAIAILAGVVNFLPSPNPRFGSKKFTNDLGLLYVPDHTDVLTALSPREDLFAWSLHSKP